MDDIFTADWFYEEKNIGTRIKSPIELLAGIRRMLPMELHNEESQLLLQRLLGQVLFVPPNVAGWPGGKTWIDSSTLMFRLRLPQLINDEGHLNIKPKDDDDWMMGNSGNPSPASKGKPVEVKIDWDIYTKNFAAVPREKLMESLSSSLLQLKPAFNDATIKNYTGSGNREGFIKSATIQMMSTPEYQLC